MPLTREQINAIMDKAIEEYMKRPNEPFPVADDVCRPYLQFFGSDISGYEDLVFKLTKWLSDWRNAGNASE
jgi:hypothetical protein